jgi:GH15 family glucan-1,4-alpha-glucosidase
MSTPCAIRDYALIGDCETAALVHRSGSIDWLCWPRFDSEGCFAALLGRPEHGRWVLAPEPSAHRASRRYRGNTLILETSFETADGSCDVIDFMPIRAGQSEIVRLVVGRRGTVHVRSELILRFGYGQRVPWIKRSPSGDWEAVSGPHAATLCAPAASEVRDGRILSSVEVNAGDRRAFVLTYRESFKPRAEPIDAEHALVQTEAFWIKWTSDCVLDEPWRSIAARSLITIKALTYAPTGGIVAAPTTSLPECIGGTRNWDYRFCWLRDATLTLQALSHAGYRAEAAAWRDWLLRAAAGMPEMLQPIYGIGGEHRLDERDIDWLPGFSGSQPVRVGNTAYRQLQLDVYGELLDAMHQARRSGLPPEQASWRLQQDLVQHLEGCWREPDRGIWEVRNGDEQFTHSKVMVWVAFDRAIRAARRYGFEAPVARWRELRRQVRDTILRYGFDPARGSFVRSFGGAELDGSTLLIPIVGFLPREDPKVVGTLGAIEAELMDGGFVRRYKTRQARDGLPVGEGAFLACSFWYADNLALQGRYDEACAMFERLVATANDVGLLAEEIDPETNEQLGNFPQALSHLSLVSTACNLASRRGPAAARSDSEADGG